MKKPKQSKISEKELIKEYNEYVKRIGIRNAYSYQQWRNIQYNSEFEKRKLKGGEKR